MKTASVLFTPRSLSCIRQMLFCAGVAAAFTTGAVAQPSNCGSIANAYGPYDYRSDREKLPIVDGAHFPPIVEALIRGNRGSLGADLDYTLRAFPNHHRALVAVMRYGQKVQSPQPRGLPRPVECYFERALRFRPDDSIVHMIYAQFLLANGRQAEAAGQLDAADLVAEGNGFTHYNIGLIHFDMKNYPKARAQAHKAMGLGFVSTALREKLQAVGEWTEPPASGTPASASSSPRS